MTTVLNDLLNMTGIVTREYGHFKRGMLISGLPIPEPLLTSSGYQHSLHIPTAYRTYLVPHKK